MSGSSSSRLRAFWDSTRARAQVASRSHRTRRTVLILAALVLVYGLLGFFAVPPLLRNYLQNHAVAMLGRPLTLGNCICPIRTAIPRSSTSTICVSMPRGARCSAWHPCWTS